MRFVVNFAISVGVLLGINYFGWLYVHPLSGLPWPWSYLGAAALVVLVLTLLDYVSLLAYLAILGALAGGGALLGSRSRQAGEGAVAGLVVGCLLYIPFAIAASFVCLLAVSWFLPELLVLTSNNWLTLLSAVVLGLLQIPGSTNTSSQD